jgi:L-ascorbate metabolism protein UlaG (beta-lactamase superfamily)
VTDRRAAVVTEHFDGKRFHNPIRQVRGLRDFLQWMRSRQRGQWHPFQNLSPSPAPPRRVADMRVTFVNHATLLVQTGNWNVLTDPVWSERVSPVSWAGPRRHRPPGIRFADLPQIDFVLLSHNHYDHLDLPTLRRLEQRDRPTFCCGLRVGELLLRSGFRDVTELDWWDEVSPRRHVSIMSVPVQHFSGRGFFDRNRTLWTGFVLTGGAGNVFFAGDTGYGPHFEQIRQRAGPIRLALLPIGAYKPVWFMGPVHMSPEEALRAHGDLAAETSVGMHYGTFELADDGQDEPREEIERLLKEKAGEKPRFWLLENGEGRDVPPEGRRW